MLLEVADKGVRFFGGLFTFVTLVILIYGIWRGTKRPAGHPSSHKVPWLRSPWFYLITTLIFFGLCYLGWKSLPWHISAQARPWILAAGVILFFPGMSLVLWGRLALGKEYFVSSALGAQLFSGHQLLTSGPFSLVRHPMYTGLIIASLGSLLIYPVWTTLLFTIFSPSIMVRACREEEALEAEFGDQWRRYCREVPPFWPHLKRRKR